MQTAPVHRCAVYTRKSHDDGAGRVQGSLGLQREAGEAYVKSQAGEGWTLLPDRYDDAGYSGGTLRRPGLERLRQDVRAGRVDLVVVYKIDRLTRSLRDFSLLMAELEAVGAAFTAVTQAIDTSTSTGRLMLNVLLSFAQFERELTSDRLRDASARARAKGLWITGARPYGYEVDKGRLTVREDEAAVIRWAYARYPRVGSLRRLATEMTAQGHRNRLGLPWTPSTCGRMLTNRLYLGQLTATAGPAPGRHEPIVTERSWMGVQRAMAAAAGRRKSAPRLHPLVMLHGLVRQQDGRVLMHTFAAGRRRRYRYYIPSSEHRSGRGSGASDRYRAEALEDALVAVLDGLMGRPRTKSRSEAETCALVRRLVERVDLRPEAMVVTLTTGAIVEAPLPAPIRRRAGQSQPIDAIHGP